MSDEAVEQTPQVEGTETAPTNSDALPEWVRDKLTEANKEAAKYRVRAKEATQQAEYEAEQKFSAQLKELTDAKSALEADLNKTRLEAAKLSAAVSVGVSGEQATEFASFLQGETPEEILASAEKAKSLFGTQSQPTRFTDKSLSKGGSEVAVDSASVFHSFVMGNLSH